MQFPNVVTQGDNMTYRQLAGPALGLTIALTLCVAPRAQAQIDTRRTTSDQRIPVRKESGGEVAISTATARIDSLEQVANAYRQRLNALEAENASMVTRSAATD